MILLYRVLTTFLYPFLLILTFFRIIIKKEDPIRFKEKIFSSHFNVKRNFSKKLIWFHASSIGELKSIFPIIKNLNTSQENLEFLITSTTVSSSIIAEVELEKLKNIQHRFFPYDVSFLVKKFLILWKPDRIFLVDSEIWPNLILSAKKYQIPLALINARITSKTFKRWNLFPNAAKEIFGLINLYLCSNRETKTNLEKLDLSNIYYKGNIKLIGNIKKTGIKNINENILNKKKFWFAASTHKGEDIFCLKTHLELKKKFEDIMTIIAPRHIQRAKEICSLANKFYLNTQILNDGDIISKDKEIIIINYFGALNSFFKYSKSVFIGKSAISKFLNTGGQNPLEAAKLNCKIYHGPYVYNFKEIYKILEDLNISKEINNFEELSKNLIDDFESDINKHQQSSDLLEEFEKKTLEDTMKIINGFIS